MNNDITGLYVIGYFRLFLHMWIFWIFVICLHTVKRVDKVVRHPPLVTQEQDQFTQVLKKVFDIAEENFTINIELFRHFSQVSN
jgi:hypothetical protein